MNYNGQFPSSHLGELPSKDLLLHISRRMVEVIVEPHFAPADHFSVPRQFIELCEVLFVRRTRIMRMNANCRVNPVMLFGVGYRRVEPFRRACPAADRQQRFNTGRSRAFEHRLAIRIKLREFKMCVGIDYLQFFSCGEVS